MKQTDMLFKQTVARVGYDNMQGIVRLMDNGYNGIAEKHTVQKLFTYVKALESKLNINIEIPDPVKTPIKEGMIKINQGGITYFAPSASAA